MRLWAWIALGTAGGALMVLGIGWSVELTRFLVSATDWSRAFPMICAGAFAGGILGVVIWYGGQR